MSIDAFVTALLTVSKILLFHIFIMHVYAGSIVKGSV